MKNIHTINRQLLFEHKRLNVRKDIVAINDDINEYVYVDKNDAVGIIAIVEDEIWLVEQYRHSVHERLLEIPGGKIEKGEQPINAAKRELNEELGLDAKNIDLFMQIYIHPSLCNESVYIFIANDFILTKQKLEKTEKDLKIVKVKIDELRGYLLTNRFSSAPDGYVLALLLLKYGL